MNEKKKTTELLKNYMTWPVLFAVLSVVTAVCVLFFDRKSGIICLIAAAVSVAAALIIYFSFRQKIMQALVGFAMNNDVTQKELAENLDIPYAIMEPDGTFAWCDAAFDTLSHGDNSEKTGITDIFPEIDAGEIAAVYERGEYHCTFREKRYKVVIRPAVIEEQKLYAVYLYDETTELKVKTKAFNDELVLGLIYLDNYEEAMESVEEVKRSLLIALVDRQVSKYISDIDGVVKKLEKDKYIFIIKRMYLSQLENAHFDILEEVKKVGIGTSMKITASIGVGVGSDTFSGAYTYARNAIDMALGRGGDQAVIKENAVIRYYGGKSQSKEKATRVKARVKALAFRELLADKDRIIIMGHKLPDIDCLGAAVGIWRIAADLGRKAHIITGDMSPSIRNMIDALKGSDYPADIFIDKAKAMDLADEGTLLCIVDVNRPALTECPELLDLMPHVVVFDHHRQSSEIIEQAVLSYVEPYASSACEMVTEIVQYIDDDIKLKAPEADVMYAGIVIDTNNFTNQAGVRTFEAAAFLRKRGADITKVRKAFRDSVEDYRARTEAIHNAELYKDFAIGECMGEGLSSPTVVGAQAANELLNIEGIKASVVMTRFKDQIYISARSIDEVNVQTMMEKLGGGGHRSIAGAQLKDATMDEAREKIKAVIDEIIKRGELTR